MENVIEIREAEIEDSDDLFRWRNHPEIRRHFFNEAELDSDEHKEWLIERLKNNDVKIYIAMQSGEKIGVIRFEPADEGSIYISVNLNPEYLQRKCGKPIFLNGMEWFIMRQKGRAIKSNVALQHGKSTGTLKFEFIDKKSLNVSVNLNPEYLYMGLGKVVILKGTEKFISDSIGKHKIVARIKGDNIRSIKAFGSSGYIFRRRKEEVVEYEFRK